MSSHENLYNLDAQLERSVEWLKFAETKNAISLTIASGLLFALLQQTKINNAGILLCAIHVVLILNIILLIYSFIPRLSWKLKHVSIIESPNLHYFGHISMLSLDDYRKLVVEHYSGYDINSKYFRDITDQIKINCDIAMYKFFIFKYSCMVFLTITILFIIYFLWK